MSVMITDICVNCDACTDECPEEAIIGADVSPSYDGDYYYAYVKPEECMECVDTAIPRCAEVCPAEGCIVWDMPYTAEYNEHFMRSEKYVIKVDEEKGLLSPLLMPKPYRENISVEERMHHKSVDETLDLYM